MRNPKVRSWEALNMLARHLNQHPRMVHEFEPCEDMYLGYKLHLRLVRWAIPSFIAILRILLATLGR